MAEHVTVQRTARRILDFIDDRLLYFENGPTPGAAELAQIATALATVAPLIPGDPCPHNLSDSVPGAPGVYCLGCGEPTGLAAQPDPPKGVCMVCEKPCAPDTDMHDECIPF